MLIRCGLIGLVIAGGVGAVVGMSAATMAPASAPAPAMPAAAAEYAVDGVHSSMVFRIKHMNTAYFYGQFTGLSGAVNFDEADPTASSLNIEVKIDSVATHAAKRDAHLKSPDFFNAEQFPTATFKSTSFAKAGEDTFDVAGDLTLHGVTKPVTVKLEKTGGMKGQRGEIIGFATEFTIKRSDFGMSYMLDGLGDEVKIMLGLECKKQ